MVYLTRSRSNQSLQSVKLDETFGKRPVDPASSLAEDLSDKLKVGKRKRAAPKKRTKVLMPRARKTIKRKKEPQSSLGASSPIRPEELSSVSSISAKSIEASPAVKQAKKSPIKSELKRKRKKKAMLVAKCQLEGIPGESLPGRENEFAEIVRRCGDALQAGQGTCLYISGVPGTGKTATVHRAMAYLKAQAPQETETELAALRQWRVPEYYQRKEKQEEQVKPARPRGRPRKNPPKDPALKRPRGRPRKTAEEKAERKKREKKGAEQKVEEIKMPLVGEQPMEPSAAIPASMLGGLPAFDYVEMNGMKVGEPVQCYSILWQALTGESIGGQLAIRRLTERFGSSHNHRPCIVVLDELDLLLRRKQSVLYHFFEWAGWPHSHLVIVAIANTMDLPERYLSNRIASRLGLGRLYFKPYQHAQLRLIIEHTLAEWRHLFHPDAIEFCARKVSAVSGDARRAIGLARRAVDWILTNQSPGEHPVLNGKKTKKQISPAAMITMDVVNKALQLSMAGNLVQVMSNCTRQQKIFLIGLLLTNRRQEVPATVDRLCEQHAQLCRTLSLPLIPNEAMLRGMIGNLLGIGLIRTGDGKLNLSPSTVLSLQATADEVQAAMGSEATFQRFLTAA